MTKSLYKTKKRLAEATELQKLTSKFQMRVNRLQKEMKNICINNRLKKIQNKRDNEFKEILKKLNMEVYEKVKKEIIKRGLSYPKLKVLKKEFQK